MPAKYLDFGFFIKVNYGIAKEYRCWCNILAIRNLLFANLEIIHFHPSIGINIKKYQFDILDNETVNAIESEIQTAVNKHIDSISGIDVQVRCFRWWNRKELFRNCN